MKWWFVNQNENIKTSQQGSVLMLGLQTNTWPIIWYCNILTKQKSNLLASKKDGVRGWGEVMFVSRNLEQ